MRCCSCCNIILYASYISEHLRKTPNKYLHEYLQYVVQIYQDWVTAVTAPFMPRTSPPPALYASYVCNAADKMISDFKNSPFSLFVAPN